MTAQPADLETWKAEHGVVASGDHERFIWEDDWVALIPGVEVAEGETEHQACARLAERLGLPMPPNL